MSYEWSRIIAIASKGRHDLSIYVWLTKTLYPDARLNMEVLLKSLLILFALGTLMVSVRPVSAQMTLVHETAPSPAQMAYLDTFGALLQEYGLTSGLEIIPVEGSEVEVLLDKEVATFGLVYLDSRLSEGRSASTLLATPAAFGSLEDFRTAQQGVLGDLVREEIGGDNLLALRLWTHSSGALVSTTRIAGIDDLMGLQVMSSDPLTASVLSGFGSSTVSVLFDQTITAMMTGQASSAVVSQDFLMDDAWQSVSLQSIIQDHKRLTAVILVKSDWWLEQTARTQRDLFSAMDAAERSAQEVLQIEVTGLRSGAEEEGYSALSWADFPAAAVRAAVTKAVVEQTGTDPEPLLRALDAINSLAPAEETSAPDEPEIERDEGSLGPKPRVFFATDRRYDAQERWFSDRFGNEVAEDRKVRCGELAPADPYDVGRINGVVELLPGGTVLNRKECLEAIVDAAEGTNGHVLVYVHGYNNTFEEAAKTGVAFARDTALPVTLIVWSWPSRGGLKHYGYDGESVAISQPRFRDLVEDLLARDQVTQVDFVAHSMGTRLLAWFMRDHWPPGSAAVVLSAADVSRPLLADAVRGATGAAVTLHATEWDLALQTSRMKNGRARAGHLWPDMFLMSELDTIDLSDFDRMLSLNHSHGFRMAEVVADLSVLFEGHWRAVDRGLPTAGSGATYYRIERQSN